MKPTSRGFTLVEVMIAGAILVMAALPIVIIFPNAYMSLNRSGERTVAITLAQQQIESLRNQPYAALTTGTTTEQLAGAYAGYTRTTVIQVDNPVVGVTLVKVSVTTAGGLQVKDLTSVITDSG